MLIQTQDKLPSLSPFNPYASNVRYQAEENNISSPNSWIRCSPAASETFLTISQDLVMLCGLVPWYFHTRRKGTRKWEQRINTPHRTALAEVTTLQGRGRPKMMSDMH